MTRQQREARREMHGVAQTPIVVSSLNNPAVKRIRGLRLRKERDRTGRFFVEGIRPVRAALERGAKIETLILVPEQAEEAPAVSDLARPLCHLPLLCVTRPVLQWLAGREDTQGVGAVVRQEFERLGSVRPDTSGRWVVLDGIQYPGNLGTILRACDAVACTGVILIGDTADPFDPIAVRASMGAVFYQRLVRCGFEEFAAWRARHNVALIGTSPDAAANYRQMAYRTPAALYLGCEGKGLPPERLAACDAVVSIPMAGRCDSLNVAMAASVLLYEIYHQVTEG